MDDQIGFYPSRLTRSQLGRLSEYVDGAAPLTPDCLREEAEKHLQEAVAAYQGNRLVNIRLAEAVRGVIEQVTADWKILSEQARPWLAGAILYFAKSNDESDFTSAIGFEDLCMVLKACLRFAKLDELYLSPEDYDGV